MSPFQSRCTNSFHSISQLRVKGCLGFIYSCGGQVAPEMLCTEPWLPPLGKQCCLCSCWGREGPVTPAQGHLPSASSSGMLTDTSGCWLCTTWVLQPWLKLLCSWGPVCTYGSPPAIKGTFLTPMWHFCLPKTLGLVELCSQPSFAWVMGMADVVATAGLCDPSWQESWAFSSALAAYSHPAAPCTQPSPPWPDSMVIPVSSTKPLQLGYTPQA